MKIKPPAAWQRPFFQVIRSLIKRFFQDSVGRSAAALAYYLIFSFFPFLIFISVLLSFLDLPPLKGDTFQALIPIDVINIINGYLGHIAEMKNGYLLFFGLFFTIFFTSRAINCLSDAISRAYRAKEAKAFPGKQIRTLLFTLFIMLLIFCSMLLLTIGRAALTFFSRFVPIHMTVIDSWNVWRFLILAVILFVLLNLAYCVLPGKRYSFRQALPGTLAALLSWQAFSMGFSFYVENMSSYSVVYGSIGAVIVLLLWLYCSAITLIMGAELNSVLSGRTQKPPKQKFPPKKEEKIPAQTAK